MSAATIPGRRASRAREFASSVATIMSKELRSRFRGRRAFVVLTIYLAVLALIAYGAYVQNAPAARVQPQFGFDGSGLTGANASATVGQAIFGLLSIIQLLLVAVLAPAFTTGAVSLEREKATLDLLITTPIRPGAIVVGKLVSALAFIFLMILAGIPVSALVLMYGGASLTDILRQQVVLFASAIGFGTIGLFCSALIKRTQTATVIAYSALLFLTVGTFLIWRFWTAAAATTNAATLDPAAGRAPEVLLYLNPAIAMVEIVADTEITPGDMGQIMSEIRGQTPNSCPARTFCNDVTCINKVCSGAGGGIAPDGPVTCPPNADCGSMPAASVVDPQALAGHFWPRFAASFGLLSLLLTLISMRLVVPTPLAFRLRRQRAAAPLEAEQ